MAKPLPILERIKAAFPEGERRIHYVTLARRVFPEEQFPRAWRYSCNGGPPGCYMALSAALRKHNVFWKYEGNERWVYKP